MKWLILLAVTFSVILATCVNPELLAKNTFLQGLVTHELLSILVVLLTITMASVANIHLALGRLKNNLKASGVDLTANIIRARGELSRNAWSMFASFCVLLVVLFVKGGVVSAIWISACHAAAIIIVTFNLLVLYDIYISIFMLTSLDVSPHSGQQGEDGSESDLGNSQ
ncbi:hypothetical protein DEM27_31625 [Metarhizobium album]|uniref:DUF2721 domain-containing protein n=1 Tax=Metarhizobium album TaxID=2182425 RepID=A0A2U2DG67_9HYPH|nr:hypothetical protein [Rhizobium album]PWE52292.1 hypothetical protein DEM27_31625 [Rhizobium album]